MRTYKKKQCAICHQEFTPETPAQKACSPECHRVLVARYYNNKPPRDTSKYLKKYQQDRRERYMVAAGDIYTLLTDIEDLEADEILDRLTDYLDSHFLIRKEPRE